MSNNHRMFPMNKPQPRIYLDYNASAPLHPDVKTAIVSALSGLGNPSSIHSEGRISRHFVEEARGSVAAACEVRPDQVIFTSGGTEACCLGIVGTYRRRVAEGAPKRLWVDPMAHPAVLDTVEGLGELGADVHFADVTGEGIVSLADLSHALDKGLALAVVSYVNHELGNIAPVEDIVSACSQKGAGVFVDAVQGFGKISMLPLLRGAGADGFSLSAHKLGGPSGVGALVLGDGVDIDPVWPSGHQERGRRPGTENVLGIVGFGKASARCNPGNEETNGSESASSTALLPNLDRAKRVAAELRTELLRIGAVENGNGKGLSTTLSFRFPGCPGDALVQALDLSGVSVSTGAACTSGSVSASPVLLALGLPKEEALTTVRFSLGEGNTSDDVRKIAEILPEIVTRIRQSH